MKIDKEDLQWTSVSGIITAEQADQLWDALKARRQDMPRMDIVHVAYYLRAFIIMSAMGWFMNDAWKPSRWRGPGGHCHPVCGRVPHRGAAAVVWPRA